MKAKQRTQNRVNRIKITVIKSFEMKLKQVHSGSNSTEILTERKWYVEESN